MIVFNLGLATAMLIESPEYKLGQIEFIVDKGKQRVRIQSKKQKVFHCFHLISALETMGFSAFADCDADGKIFVNLF